MKIRVTFTAIALLFLCGQVHAQTTILFEDFEDATVTYTPNVADDLSDIANRDYFGRVGTGTAALPADVSYSNLQGTGFYAAQDTDGANSGNVDDVILNWTGINISGFTGLNLSWFVAEDTAADGLEDWDFTTSVRLEGRIDGGSFDDIFAVESTSNLSGNRAPAVDTNFDGLGDGVAITDTFAQFSSAIANGSTLDLRLTIEDLDTGDEDIAFDSLLLTGIAAVPEPSGLAFLVVFGSAIGLRRRRKG